MKLEFFNLNFGFDFDDVKVQSGWSVLWHRESRPWGSGLQAMQVRSTRLAWGAVFWRQKAPDRLFRRPGQTPGGEKLNHERLD